MTLTPCKAFEGQVNTIYTQTALHFSSETKLPKSACTSCKCASGFSLDTIQIDCRELLFLFLATDEVTHLQETKPAHFARKPEINQYIYIYRNYTSIYIYNDL